MFIQRSRVCRAFGATLFGAAVLCHTWPAAAQSSESWASVVSGAEKEGKLVWYSVTPPPTANRVVAAFRKTYPNVQVEIFRSASADQLARIERERATGTEGGDVWTTTDGATLGERAAAGLLLKPSGPAAAGWPANYLKQGAVIITAVEPWVLAYNTNLVKTPVTDYPDLLKPEFKGKLGTPEPNSAAMVAFYSFLTKTQGPDFVGKLKPQEPRFYNGAVPLGQALGSGEIAISAFNVPSTLRSLIDQGAPIKIVSPKQQSGTNYFTGALGWSKRPNAARLFVDFLMSRDGQTAWNGQGESASPLPNIPGALQASAITPFDPSDYPPQQVKKLSDTFGAELR